MTLEGSEEVSKKKRKVIGQSSRKKEQNVQRIQKKASMDREE